MTLQLSRWLSNNIMLLSSPNFDTHTHTLTHSHTQKHSSSNLVFLHQNEHLSSHVYIITFEFIVLQKFLQYFFFKLHPRSYKLLFKSLERPHFSFLDYLDHCIFFSFSNSFIPNIYSARAYCNNDSVQIKSHEEKHERTTEIVLDFDHL